MLNKKTLKVIQSLNPISNKMIFSYPVSSIREGKSIQAFIDMSKLDEEEFNEFGIYSLSDFISAVSLIDNPDISLKDKTIKISNKKSSINYNTSSVELLEDECSCDLSLLERVKKNEKIANFELTTEDFKNLKTASNTLKDLPNLILSSSKSGILLKIQGLEKSSNSFETIIDGESNEDFAVTANLSLLKRIPNGNYSVSIYKSKTDSRVMLFNSTDIDSLEILLAVAKS